MTANEISVETNLGPAFDVKGDWYISPNGVLCKPNGIEGDYVKVVAAYHTGVVYIPLARFEAEFKNFE